MKIQSPWIGRVRGSAGNMTGSKVYDKNVMRAKAFEVSNPNTQAQQTERSFFAEVSQCVSSVSEAELRSLFGVKPKGMSRRNTLTKQVSDAYSIDGTSKTLDFSKLLAIGNGSKVTTPICQVTPDEAVEILPIDINMLNVKPGKNPNLIVVIFDTDNNIIKLENLPNTCDDVQNTDVLYQNMEFAGNGYIYPTCTEDGSNVYEQSFGSFIIKTRAEKK